MAETLVRIYRGELLETVHMGNVAIVDENLNLKYSAGDPKGMTYYRSCAKPLQALPIFLHKLDEKYQLTQKELAVFCSSHQGEPFHTEAVLNILEKGGFSESDMIMLPTYPSYPPEAARLRLAGMPTRKIYHKCTGKHAALLMLAKETDNDYHDYYKLESHAQQEILECISMVSQWPKNRIETGIDGCGVPVYAVPLDHMALSYLKLACPEVEKNSSLAEGLRKFYTAMHNFPEMLEGTNSLCTLLNSDPNIVAKGGADGVYTIGMQKERLGIAIKMVDGFSDCLPMVIKQIFIQLGYKNIMLLSSLSELYDSDAINNAGVVVGQRVPDFKMIKY